MRSNPEVSGMVPSNGILIRRSLPSAGSRWERFPHFAGHVERSDSLPSFPRAFVFLRPAVTALHRGFAPLGVPMRTPVAGRSFNGPSHTP